MSNKEPPAAQIERLLAVKDFARAMQLSSWLCATEKSNPWGWMGRARVHFYQGRFALALEDAKAATTLEPNNPNALLLQASILNRLGVGDQSIALLRQLVSMPQPFALEASLALLNSCGIFCVCTPRCTMNRGRLWLSTGCLEGQTRRTQLNLW